MSSSLGNPFNSLLKLKQRLVTIERPGTGGFAATSIYISPSNYNRNLQGPQETVIEGREFVISKQNLDAAGLPTPKRGDRIKDPVLGLIVISEPIPMFGLGNEILGFRVRSS